MWRHSQKGWEKLNQVEADRELSTFALCKFRVVWFSLTYVHAVLVIQHTVTRLTYHMKHQGKMLS